MANGGGIQHGARLKQYYHTPTQNIVPVPVDDIKDISSYAREEVALVTGGNFFLSGSFWLGIERAITEGMEDPVLYVCSAFFVCGLLLTGVGYRQTARSMSKLARYLQD